MDTINKTLLLTLKQEAKTLNEVVNKIQTLKDRKEIRSWLFPRKSNYFVNELVCTEDIFETENFKTCLEIIIDRLHVGIQLILNYMEKGTHREPENNPFIHRPKITTLGINFERLWEEVLAQELSIQIVKATTVRQNSWTTMVLNKETQTSIISLNKCCSCTSALLCMKNVLQFFNENQIKMLLNERQFLRPKMCDITQFGSKLQTTNLIEMGLNNLYEKIFFKEQERDLLYNENQKLNAQATEKYGIIAFLQREINMLKYTLEKDSFKITLLNSQVEELSHIINIQNYQIAAFNKIINNLNKYMRIYNENIFKSASEKANLNFLFKRIINHQLRVTKFSTLLENRLFPTENEHTIMKNKLNLLRELTNNIDERLNKINNVLNTFDTKINKVNEQHEDISVLEFKLKQLKVFR